MTNYNAREAVEKKKAAWLEKGGKEGTGKNEPKFRRVKEQFQFMHLYDILSESSVFLRETGDFSKKRKRCEEAPPSGFVENFTDSVLSPTSGTILCMFLLSVFKFFVAHTNFIISASP